MASTPVENEKAVKELGRPREINLWEEREYHWPAWKFDMDMSELWQGLHDEYNTLRFPIQCQRAFHLDINELATKSKTREEFLRLMDERSWARFREVKQALDDTSADLFMTPSQFVSEGLWSAFFDLIRTSSASNLIIFFSALQFPKKAPEVEVAPLIPPGSLPIPEPSPCESPVRRAVPTQEVSHPPPNAPPDPPSLSNPSPQKKPGRAPSRRQTTDEIVKHNLRPRAAGISRRKMRKRKSPRQRRSSDSVLRNRYTVQH
ncbi:hypothetical protein F5X97DRAFT_189652 [Nemania serpens]|nr:hypothetical protein F5X97DRAFT_189652 [Nemania serpens]